MYLKSLVQLKWRNEWMILWLPTLQRCVGNFPKYSELVSHPFRRVFASSCTTNLHSCVAASSMAMRVSTSIGCYATRSYFIYELSRFTDSRPKKHSSDNMIRFNAQWMLSFELWGELDGIISFIYRCPKFAITCASRDSSREKKMKLNEWTFTEYVFLLFVPAT